MKLIFLASLEKQFVLTVRDFDFWYVGGKFETPKICEIQTIYAIRKEIQEVTGMARFLAF